MLLGGGGAGAGAGGFGRARAWAKAKATRHPRALRRRPLYAGRRQCIGMYRMYIEDMQVRAGGGAIRKQASAPETRRGPPSPCATQSAPRQSTPGIAPVRRSPTRSPALSAQKASTSAGTRPPALPSPAAGSVPCTCSSSRAP